jgi:hypothetical protein
MTGVLCAVAGATSAAGPTVQLTTPLSLIFASGGILQAVTAYRVANDAFVYTAQGTSASYSQQEQWLSDPALVGNYEVRATLNSGDTPTGTLGTWLSLSTTRSWVLTASPGNLLNANLTIEIRDTATSTVRATATVTMQSDAT